MEVIYQYLSGTEFCQRVEAIVEDIGCLGYDRVRAIFALRLRTAV
jgi:hypothetical protein